MQQHVKVLGILNIISGALCGLGGIVVLLVLGGLAGLVGMSDEHGAEIGAGFLSLIGTVIAVVLIAVGLPSIIAGIGLLNFQGWARILTIVLSALHLLNIPVGTALGVYGFWVLLKPETEALFRPRPQGWASPAF